MTVVVTGLGAVTPLGNNVDSTWQALLAGRSGIDFVTSFDGSPFGGAIAGEVRDFHPEAFLPHKQLRHMDRYAQLACVATLEALTDAGLEPGLGPDCGVVFSGSGGYHVIDHEYQQLAAGIRRTSPFLLTNMLPDSASGHIAILTGAQGPNMAVVSACATGAGSVGEAAEVIRRGDAKIMIAGGAEAPLNAFLYGVFTALRALASFDEDPGAVCKPFDLRRDGFVLAEGAGCLIIEDEDHARERGARIYAYLAGYGSSNDAYDMVASEESGRGPVLAIQMALRKAGIDPTDIGYVNAHGTGTKLNDRVETTALKQVFGPHAYPIAAHPEALEAKAALRSIAEGKSLSRASRRTRQPSRSLPGSPTRAETAAESSLRAISPQAEARQPRRPDDATPSHSKGDRPEGKYRGRSPLSGGMGGVPPISIRGEGAQRRDSAAQMPGYPQGAPSEGASARIQPPTSNLQPLPRLAISSTKSMTGHMMGGSGAVEAVISVLALHHRILPPTINYQVPDPACDLDYVPNTARPAPHLRAVLSNSIGLGGHNAALVFTNDT